MTLKSFPTKDEDRKVIWCLSETTIDKALKDKYTLHTLSESPVTIVQLPLTNLARRKSEKLRELEKAGLLLQDQVLIYSENNFKTEEKYLNVDTVVEDFLTYNLKKANVYARFFAALGAVSFKFKHKRSGSSVSDLNASANLEGVVSKIIDVDLELGGKIKEAFDQISSIEKNFVQKDRSREDRIAIAERILKESNYENDEICRNELSTFKDGVAHLDGLDISMYSNTDASKSLNTLISIGSKLATSDMQADNNSLFSFKNKFNIANAVKENFEFTLSVKF